MKWLVTGANGFLGKHVVSRLLDAGQQVRALVRPATRVEGLPWADRVEVFRGDLRRCPDLNEAFDGVDGLVHLAAAVSGSPEEQFASTVVATEKLLAAMAQTPTRRIVLVSSFSVYDWDLAGRKFDESAPLAKDRLYERDGYAIAKSWQERVVRRLAREHGWDLTVLRPGFIWGAGNEWCVGLGDKVGKCHVILGPLRHLPLTHAVNCADCIAVAAEDERAVGQTFNVVDDDVPRAWQFAGDYLKRSQTDGFRIPVPYHLGLAASVLAKSISRLCFGESGRLPGLLVPRRYVARFKSADFRNDHLKQMLDWKPPLSYSECLEQTYRTADTSRAVSRITPEAVYD